VGQPPPTPSLPSLPYRTLIQSGHVLLGVYKGVKTQPHSLCLFASVLVVSLFRAWIILVGRKFAEVRCKNILCKYFNIRRLSEEYYRRL